MSTTDIAPKSVTRALAVLDALEDTATAADVRALRDRAAGIDDHELAAVADADALRARLVADLVDGTTTAEQAGEQIVDLERRTRAVDLGADALFDDVRAELAERVRVAAAGVGDGWVTAMRPAVDRLAAALEKATRLTDGQLDDAAAGNGPPSHRAALDAVRAAYPLADEARDVAWALRADRLVPTDGLVGDLSRYVTAGNWTDEDPVRRSSKDHGYQPTHRDPARRVILLARDYGAVPDLATAEQIAERPSAGARHAVKLAEQEQAKAAAVAQAQRLGEQLVGRDLARAGA